MPAYLPLHSEAVYISGFFEVLGGIASTQDVNSEHLAVKTENYHPQVLTLLLETDKLMSSESTMKTNSLYEYRDQ